MMRAGRTTLVLEGALWLAAATLFVAMVWLHHHPLPVEIARGLPWSPDLPALRVHTVIRPRIGEDRILVESHYTLLRDWETNRLVLFPMFGNWEKAVALDGGGPLATSTIQPGTDEPQLGILLHRTKAGSSFCLRYEARTWFTGMHSVGRLWLGTPGPKAIWDITWVVPYRETPSGIVGHVRARSETWPKPHAVWAGDDGTYIQFRDLDSYQHILLSYEPAGGLSPFADRRMVRTVSLGSHEHVFVVHYPRQAEDVALDVCGFCERMFPLLVAQVSAAPTEHRTDILLRPRTPISEHCTAYHDSVHHHVNIYLQKLGLRPSLFMGHEMLHGYVQASIPTYMEEGLVEHFNQRLLWSVGIEQWSGPVWFGRQHFDVDLLTRKGYGKDRDAMHKGYGQGEELFELMYLQLPGREVDLPLELLLHLRDSRTSLQTAVATIDHGRELFEFLNSYGLGAGLRPPEHCTSADQVEVDPASDRYTRWMPPPRILIPALLGVGLLLYMPMAAPIVFLVALLLVVPMIPAYGHPPQTMVERFVPGLAAGIVEGAVGTRAVVAFIYAPIWRRLRARGRQPSVWRGVLLNTLVLLFPLACLSIPLWGPVLLPAYLDGMDQLAIVFFALGALLSSPLALVELRLGGYVP